MVGPPCPKLLRVPCGSRRKSLCCRCSKRLCVFFTVMFLVVPLHLFILPASMGYYNDECYISKEDREDMLYLIKAIVDVFQLYNQTYWFDFGTLIGAVRNGDILPYDGDIDICRMLSSQTTSMSEGEFGLRLFRFFVERNITGNTMAARYKNAKADLCRFVFRKKGDKTLLEQYYPSHITDQLKEKVMAQFLVMEIEQELILPTKTMLFAGMQVSVPQRAKELLRLRYPYTWWFSMPYKWKCFLPL